MNFVKGLLLSVLSLAAGFVAITLPFKLFSHLTGDALHLLFFIEIAIYLIVGSIFLIIAERKKQQKMKSKQRHIERSKKIKKVQEEWINLAA